jgi:hypothetical protein
MTEPQQKPGRSKQDYGTPPSFLEAIAARFGYIDLDLACSVDNLVAPCGIIEQLDALKQDWASPSVYVRNEHYVLDRVSGIHVAFCNPPFADIRPWAAKCESVRFLPRKTLLLVPASMGSKWWVDHVLGQGMAFGIPRLQFVGADGLYPKDLSLILYTSGVHGTGYWDWRLDVPKEAKAAE